MSDHAPDPALSRAAMRAALDAARLGAPSPNPHVGAAVVRDGAVVSVGHHQAAGHDHAEVAALRALGDDARGATVFVTLEPCNHHGRTPPCTEALIRAGVSRVVFAVADPNPHVTGHGRRALEAAGVTVVHGFDGELQREAERLLAPWSVFITRGRAHVTLKAAMSLDGRIATRTGESRWITGPAARADVHALRARCDAVVVGAGTARADDPMLTVRHVETARQPTRVVLATGLDLPHTLTMVRTAREVPTWVVYGEGLGDPAQRRRLEDAGVLLLPVATEGSGDTRRLSLRATFAALAARGVVSALVEGGGEVHGGIVDAGLVDRAVLYVAPMILGGGGAAAVGGVGVERLTDALRLRDLRAERVGDDLRIEGECDVHGDHPVGR
ncbi:MAG: bifunctional diaminohydroxyphosphoribosylaminopyrimidine deaminase/5-amino-6-(5-phosphoribosylamino)uracil reductase RibD [Polyangiales bacterium]